MPLTAARNLGLPSLGMIGGGLALSSAGRISDANSTGIPTLLLVLLAAVVYTGLTAVMLGVVRQLTDAAVTTLLVLALVVAVAFFVVGYHYLGPAYADSDEAIDTLADSLLQRFNPYERRTYLDNTISPMMGAGVLALPFRVLLGTGAWQNPAWVVIGTGLLWRHYGTRAALTVIVLVFSSVGFSADYVFGGDYFISGIVLAVAVFSFLWALDRRDAWMWPCGVLLGVAVTNRLSSLPLLAVLAAALYGAGRLRDATWPLVLAVAVSVVLWVPWWLTDPAVYAPLQRRDFIGPWSAQLVVVIVSVGVLALAAFGRFTGSAAQRFAICGSAFALTLAPAAVFMPSELHRVAPFLLLALPLFAARKVVGASGVSVRLV